MITNLELIERVNSKLIGYPDFIITDLIFGDVDSSIKSIVFSFRVDNIWQEQDAIMLSTVPESENDIDSFVKFLLTIRDNMIKLYSNNSLVLKGIVDSFNNKN